MKSFELLKTVAVVIVGCLLLFNLTKTSVEISKKGERLTNLQKEVENLRIQEEALKKQVAAADDPAFIEREARERLKMTRPGERIVVIPDTTTNQTEEVNGQTAQTTPNWKQWLDLITKS